MRFKICNGNCLDIMQFIKPKSVDLIYCDLPFGVTRNKWDIVIPFEKLWPQYKRIIKDNGVVALNAIQPFTSLLVTSNLEMFKYELIWEKSISSNQLNVKKQPLRAHESIIIFYKAQPVYNEQLEVGAPYSIKRSGIYNKGNYNSQRESEKINTGYRHAKSIVKVSNPRIRGGHPTQKPVELSEYIIKTFTNKNAVVLDNCMGSGTTGVACLNLGRRFIGIEMNKIYFDSAQKRMLDREKEIICQQ